MSAKVRLLKPASKYKLRVVAINGVGSSEPSYETVITTMEETPRDPPAEVKVIPMSATELKVTWKVIYLFPN